MTRDAKVRKQHFAPGRRQFMVGAAGLTFGVAFGVPPMLKLAVQMRKPPRRSLSR